MSRVHNFGPGPACLPEEVLREAADEMLNFGNSGMSVMEMSHRSPAFEGILGEAQQTLRDLMGIPDGYDILFLQGGASTQFAMVPLNLSINGKADYLVTGSFAKKAMQEGKKYLDVRIAASSEEDNFTYVPDVKGLSFRQDADYVHICENNTIYGTKYWTLPDTGSIPLVADMSSCILSEPADVSKYGLIYAGAQKNIGPAGVTLVIIRKDLVRNEVLPSTPTMLKYATHAKENSMYNTPPCYAIYICGKVFKWLKKQGGLSAMQEVNKQKAKLLYDVLDDSKLFTGTARKDSRSMMNVTFVTGDEQLDAAFVAGAKKEGLVNIKGHRSVGGMRASIYNAMSLEGVEKLAAYMRAFEKEHVK